MTYKIKHRRTAKKSNIFILQFTDKSTTTNVPPNHTNKNSDFIFNQCSKIPYYNSKSFKSSYRQSTYSLTHLHRNGLDILPRLLIQFNKN